MCGNAILRTSKDFMELVQLRGPLLYFVLQNNESACIREIKWSKLVDASRLMKKFLFAVYTLQGLCKVKQLHTLEIRAVRRRRPSSDSNFYYNTIWEEYFRTVWKEQPRAFDKMYTHRV